MAEDLRRDEAASREQRVPAVRRLQGVEQRVRRRSLQAPFPQARARPALPVRPAGRPADAALSLSAEQHLSRPVGDQPDGLARPADRGAAGSEDDPHRLRRFLDGHRRPLRAVLLSGVRRLLAESLGPGEEARCALRGAELGAREQRLDRSRRDREDRSPAAPSRPGRLLRRRQPVPARVDRREGS